MSDYIILIIKIILAILLAILFGNGSVVMFNRIPVHMFETIGEDDNKTLPDELREMGDGTRQRITSTPWKYVFTAYFGIVGIFLALHFSLQYEIAVLFVLVIALEIAISDWKYKVVPDMLNVLLAISAVGFVSFQEEWWSPFIGVAAGIFIVMFVYFTGKIIYKRSVIGGADLKFFAAIGLIAGGTGTLILFVITQLFLSLHAIYLLVSKRIQKGSTLPMLPYAFVALTVYFLFLWDIIPLIAA